MNANSQYATILGSRLFPITLSTGMWSMLNYA